MRPYSLVLALVLAAGCSGTNGAFTVDGGELDAGSTDGGPTDAGPTDAGPVDAGPTDAGPSDAGPSDAGQTDACTPVDCAEAAVECGPLDDGCGGTLDCGGCGTGELCREGACVADCAPTTCAAEGVECGPLDDGCGATLDCGGCGAGASCVQSACVPDCVPETCASLGRECGQAPDGCGGTLRCGGCAGAATCGGGGVPGACGEPCAGDTCDHFDRDLAGGLGTSSSGVAWWVEDAGATRVENGVGILAAPPGASRHARLGFAPQGPDYTVRVKMAFEDPTNQQGYVVARFQGDDARANQYLAGWNGHAGAWVIRERNFGGVGPVLASFSQAAPAAGVFHHVVLQVQGGVVRMRAWPDGATEPNRWAGVFDASTADPGAPGLRTYNDSGLSSALAVRFDDLQVDVAQVPSGGIRLDIDFDSGSLDLAASSVSGNTVNLVGRDVGNSSGTWKWVHFRASNVSGLAPRFVISSAFASGSSRLSNHKMVWSADGQTWRFFGHGELDTAAGEYRFWNDNPFSADRVFVAYGLPYPYRRVIELAARLSASPWVSPTPSGNANLVIGESPGGTDDLGRTVTPNPLYGLRITDDSATGAKQKVVLVGGVHPNETTGSLVLDALVEWLVGSSPEAAALRRAAVFYVYPMVNPDGRFAGYNRSTVETPGEDPNRAWSSSEWANNTEVRLVAQAAAADAGADVDYFIDFHSTVGTGAHYAYLDVDASPTGRDMTQAAFWTRLRSLDPLSSRDGSYVGRTGMRYGWSQLGATFSSTFEMYFRPGENLARYRRLGENVGLAFHAAIVGP